jgi:hypothetical protein
MSLQRIGIAGYGLALPISAFFLARLFARSNIISAESISPGVGAIIP